MPIDNQPIAGKHPGQDVGSPGVVTPPPPLKKPSKKNLKLDKPSKNLKDIIDIRPKVMEASEKHAVMTFGRMNPPTTGHEKLIHKTHSIAQKHGTKANIILSHTHDKKNNPLPQKHKINYVKKIHPGVNVTGSDKTHPTFLHQAKKLHAAGHDHLHVVAGSDRVHEYKTILNKYNGHKDHYNFKSITVHSAGHRDPDSEGTSGISGTKMRAHAKAGDHKSFKAGLPKSLHKDHKRIMSHINEAIEEAEWEELFTEEVMQQLIEEDYQQQDIINERVLTMLQRRKAGLKMRRLRFRIARARKLKRKRMATTDMLTRRARRQARNFIRKRIAGKQGGNYAALSPSQKIQIDKRVEKKQAFINKLAKRLLPKVKQAELARLRSARAKKEDINLDFSSYLAELSNGGQTSSSVRGREEAVDNQSKATATEAADPRIKQLKDKHKNEKDTQKDRHAIEHEKLKVQMAKQKQAEIRREAKEVAEAVDVLVDALGALQKKADIASVDLDTLFIPFIEGYNNPHGEQTPQQGGFANVNRLIAEMSQAEKDKAEDIVKGMKKDLSGFKRRYGKDYKSVMYATANKKAQEQVGESLKDWFGKGKKGDWVRVGVDGKIKGDCAREEGEGKPKCMPRSKAHSMDKKDRASAARRKRAADPVADRPGKGGKPIMVKTQKEEVKPSGKATKPYSSHGIPKDATKAELQAIRSNPKSSKGKKQLAHWKLNMHKEEVDSKDTKVLKKLSKQLAGSMKAHGDQKKMLDKAIKEASKPNNPKLWAAKKAAAKAKFDVYPSAYANGWAAKQYKAAGGTWRSAKEGVEYPKDAQADLNKMADKKKDNWWKHQDKAKVAADKKKTTMEGGEAGWARFNKKQGRRLRDALRKERELEKNKSRQFDRDEDGVKEGMGAAYAPGTGETGIPERELTSKAVKKQLNRNRNREKMKGNVQDPSIRYVHKRDRSTDYTRPEKKKHNKKVKEDVNEVIMTGLAAKAAGAAAAHIGKAAAVKAAPYVAGAAAAYGAKKYAQHKIRKKREQDMLNKAASQAVAQYRQDHENHHQQNESNDDKTKKMTQLFRMGLAKKGELHTMLRMLKRNEDALKDPKLRGKMYELLDKLTDLVTTDGQIFVKVRQAVQKNRDDLQAVEEMFEILGKYELNERLNSLNIDEDMSGMSVSSGHKRSVDQGAGMTKKGVAAYRRRNPGSKLQTAVTTPPSKLKAGSKAAKRRKAFCSRSRSWTGERGKAARRRWNC